MPFCHLVQMLVLLLDLVGLRDPSYVEQAGAYLAVRDATRISYGRCSPRTALRKGWWSFFSVASRATLLLRSRAPSRRTRRSPSSTRILSGRGAAEPVVLYNRTTCEHAASVVTAYFRQDYLTTPDGARLYFQVQGEGDPAVVMCDGIGCDGFAWKYLLPQMKQSHRVVRWHYRGHGRSGVPEDRSRIGFQYTADDLTLVLDAAGVDKALVFGHSMGVQVSLEFHRRHRERCVGLVLLCGSYGFPLDTVHDDTLLRRLFPFVRLLVELLPGPARKLHQMAMKTELALELALRLELNPELLQRNDLVPYFDHLARMDPVVFIRTLESLAEHTAWDHLPRINVPTLIIGGEKDRFTPLWLSRRMAEAIRGSEFMIVPHGSHTAPLEQPQLVAQRIERFLRTRILTDAGGAGSSKGIESAG